MATVTQLLDRGCNVTGLRNTGSERALALQALNNSYMRAVADAELRVAQVAQAAAGTPSVDTEWPLPSALKLRGVSVLRHGAQCPLEQVSEDEFLMHASVPGGGDGIPRYFAVFGTGHYRVYPSATASTSMRVSYVPTPPVLVESAPAVGQETSPSYVHALWHWDVLLPGMVLELLDKDQRKTDVDFWAGRYQAGLERMRQWSASFGGDANRMFVSSSGAGVGRFPDQRS